MTNNKPTLDVWDSCCLIGILNGEKDKLPALLAQTQFFESGAAFLGVPIAGLTEVFTLSDGTPADEKLRKFIDNSYVVTLQSNLEVTFKSNSLRYRFDAKRMPELKTKAVASGVAPDKANRLGVKDSEILASALIYKAQRLTTYDPFLIFLGAEYITPETGLIIGLPQSSLLPFPPEVSGSSE